MADDTPVTLSLVAPLGTAALEQVHGLVGEACERSSTSMIDHIRFETAVIEIANNILEHSQRTDPPSDEPRTFDVVLAADRDALTAEFRDDGRPAVIDFRAISMPDAEAEAGRGLALALAAVDDVTHEHRDGLNIWRIVCRRTT